MAKEAKPDAAPNLASKEWLLLVPLLGSGLAVTYDAGYFAGIGLHFFTFFSLSEHIVFALGILPLAIIGAAASAAIFAHQLRLRAVRTSGESLVLVVLGFGMIVLVALLATYVASLLYWVLGLGPLPPLFPIWFIQIAVSQKQLRALLQSP